MQECNEQYRGMELMEPKDAGMQWTIYRNGINGTRKCRNAMNNIQEWNQWNQKMQECNEQYTGMESMEPKNAGMQWTIYRNGINGTKKCGNAMNNIQEWNQWNQKMRECNEQYTGMESMETKNAGMQWTIYRNGINGTKKCGNAMNNILEWN